MGEKMEGNENTGMNQASKDNFSSQGSDAGQFSGSLSGSGNLISGNEEEEQSRLEAADELLASAELQPPEDANVGWAEPEP